MPGKPSSKTRLILIGTAAAAVALAFGVLGGRMYGAYRFFSEKVPQLQKPISQEETKLFPKEGPLAQAPAPAPGRSAAANDPQPARRSRLPVRLVSSLSIGDGGDSRSSAKIQSRGLSGSQEARSYTVGEDNSFWPGVKITKILPDRVEFMNRSVLEYIELSRVEGPLPAASLGMPSTAQAIGSGSSVGAPALLPEPYSPPKLVLPENLRPPAAPTAGNPDALFKK